MSEKEKNILKTLERVLPELSDLEKGRLLGYGEGIEAARAGMEEKRERKTEGGAA